MDVLPPPPHADGPVWQKTSDGRWYLPELSLGWGVINWLAEYVNSPGADGGPFIPTLEQARFIAHWYAVDENGEYLYSRGITRKMKGSGKDPLAAVMALAELCGPVAFDRFDAAGMPVGKPRHAAWVQAAAVSYEQNRNLFALMPVLISRKMKKTYGLDVNRFLIYSAAGGRMEAVTSAARSMEGNRPTFVVLNEVQWWTESNGGHNLAGVITGNVTKVRGARSLSLCNAFVPGEDSVAERDYEAWQAIKADKAVDTGILYDSIEAPADTPLSEIPSKAIDPDGHEAGLARLRAGLEVARGDAKWLDVEAIINAILDVRNPPTESRRKFLNQIIAAEDAFIAPTEWDACRVDSRLAAKDRVALGFDGSKSGDWTALVACRIDDGHVQLIKAWNPERHGGEVPTEDVDAVVRSTFDRYQVVAARFDVRMFESYIDAWTRDFRRVVKVNASPGKPLAFDMRNQGVRRFSLDAEAFLEAVLERQISHDGNPTLRSHIMNSKRYGTTWGTMSIRKTSKDSDRKIDAAVCAVLAFGARRDYLTSKVGGRTGKLTIVQ